jgi:hypothetical protein
LAKFVLDLLKTSFSLSRTKWLRTFFLEIIAIGCKKIKNCKIFDKYKYNLITKRFQEKVKLKKRKFDWGTFLPFNMALKLTF